MRRNTIVMVGAVLLALAVSVPLSYGVITSTVTIENNQVILVPDLTGGITIGDDDDGEDDYIPELENLPYEGGHPVVGIQEPGGSSNVVPDGEVEEFRIIIPAGMSFCIKIKEKHIMTSPTISISMEDHEYVTESLSGGGFNVEKTTYYSVGNLKTDGKTMEAKTNLSAIVPYAFDESIVIHVEAGRKTSGIGGAFGSYPQLELSIIIMN